MQQQKACSQVSKIQKFIIKYNVGNVLKNLLLKNWIYFRAHKITLQILFSLHGITRKIMTFYEIEIHVNVSSNYSYMFFLFFL